MKPGLDPAMALAHGEQARFVEEVMSIGSSDDRTFIVCRGRVPALSPTVADGVAGVWATLELAAQAAALLQATTAEDEGAPVSGYLVRVRRTRFTRPAVPADTSLVTRVERRASAGALTLFAAHVALDGETIATAELGTFSRQD